MVSINKVIFSKPPHIIYKRICRNQSLGKRGYLAILLCLFQSVAFFGFVKPALADDIVKVDTLEIKLTHLEPGKTLISNQIWSVEESSSGYVFFAEAEGIVAMRGRDWSLIETPNATTVRSLGVKQSDTDEEIYYGEKDDFGKIIVDSLGIFKAFSLKHTIPDSIQFGDVWSTHVIGDDVYFQSRHYIFKYSNNKTEIIQSVNGFHNSFSINERLFVREFGIGLKEFVPGKGLQLIKGGDLLSNQIVIGITADSEEGLNIWSQSGVIYKQKSFSDKLTSSRYFSAELKTFSDSLRFYTIEQVENNLYAIGTIGAGLIFVNGQGDIVKVLDKASGFPDQSVNYLKKSRFGGLWIALDNEGVIFSNKDTGLLKYSRESGVSGYINDISFLDDKLLLATGRGLFLSERHRNSLNHKALVHHSNPQPDEFDQIITSSSIWHVYQHLNEVFVAGEAGLSKLEKSESGYNLNPCVANGVDQNGIQFQANVLASSERDDLLFVGLNLGLGIVRNPSDSSCEVEIVQLGDKIEVRSLVVKDNVLWIGTVAYGVWAATIDYSNTLSPLSSFSKSVGHFPGRNDVISWDNDVVIINKEQLSKASISNKGEITLEELTIGGLNSHGSFSNLSPITGGKAWVILKDSLIQVAHNKNGYKSVSTPKALIFNKSGTSSAIVGRDNVLWFNDGSTLVRYDSEHDLKTRPQFQAYISELILSSTGEVYFNGVHRNELNQITKSQLAINIPNFSYDERNISVKLTANEFTKPDAVQFRYKIDGFSSTWSEWDFEATKVFSTLKEGEYVFRGQAKDEVGRLSEEAVYAFTILPPWFRTQWAYFGYLMCFVALTISAQKYVIMRRAHNDAKEQALELKRNQVVVKKLQEANDRLLKANKLKDEFLATTSHELRTPLTAILGFTNVLKDEIPEDAEYREFLNIIEDSGHRLMDTLESLLDLAKLRAGIMEINPEVVDVYAQCLKEASKFTSFAEEKGLQLNVLRPEQPLYVKVDVHALSRVLHNLLSNAIKFTDFGKVEIEFEEQSEAVAMKVRDTGIGIDAKFLPDLFDAFIQESDGLSRTYEGTGLGLAICSGLVLLMDSTMTVESNKGQGSTFIVALPRAHKAATSPVRVLGMGQGASA